MGTVKTSKFKQQIVVLQFPTHLTILLLTILSFTTMKMNTSTGFTVTKRRKSVRIRGQRQPQTTLWDRFQIFPHGFLLFATVSLVAMAIVASPGRDLRRRMLSEAEYKNFSRKKLFWMYGLG